MQTTKNKLNFVCPRFVPFVICLSDKLIYKQVKKDLAEKDEFFNMW